MPAPAPSRRGLSRDSRLKHGRDFARLKQSGQRSVNGCLIANWLALADGSRSRLGVVVGSKIGNSVIRSRAKRLLRESFRLHQHELRQPLDLVLVGRPSIAARDFAGVEKDLLATLRRAGLLKPVESSAGENAAAIS